MKELKSARLRKWNINSDAHPRGDASTESTHCTFYAARLFPFLLQAHIGCCSEMVRVCIRRAPFDVRDLCVTLHFRNLVSVNYSMIHDDTRFVENTNSATRDSAFNVDILIPARVFVGHLIKIFLLR